MKILIVKTSSLGDIVHTFPAISDLQSYNNGIVCDWVVEEAFSELPKLHPLIRKVIPIALRRWRHNILLSYKNKEISVFLKLLREEKYDYIIDPQGLLKSAIISMLAKGKRFGYSFKSIREPAASIFYNKKYLVSKELHAITRIRELFSSVLGYSYTSKSPVYKLKDVDVPLPISIPEKYIIFFHGTSQDRKCWATEKWIDLAKKLSEQQYTILLPWGNKKEEIRAEQIVDKTANTIKLPKCTILEITKMIIHAQGIVGLDTGFGHLTAAYGVPAVSLYGPTKISLIGAWGENQKHMDLYHDQPSLVAKELTHLIAKSG